MSDHPKKGLEIGESKHNWQVFLLQHRFFPVRSNLLLRHGTIFHRVAGAAVWSDLKTVNFFVKRKFKLLVL